MRSIRSSLVALGLMACGGSSQAGSTEAAATSASGSEAGGEAKLTEPLIVKDVGFSTPESVLYDAKADVYLVSNIQGSPLDADDQAFISRVKPDGRVEALKWIDSAGDDVALDAPKGMALVGDVLYVADITNVRKFDRKTGKPRGSIRIEGSTFLNDLTADKSGTVFVSDSGLTTGFAPSGTDAIYRIDARGHVTPLVKDPSLGRPNGLLATADGLWVVTFGSGEMYKVDAHGQRSAVHKMPKGSLDGIVDAAGTPLVSSWEGSAVYSCGEAGEKEVVSGVAAPADIGFDAKRQRLLIPLFNDNAIEIAQL